MLVVVLCALIVLFGLIAVILSIELDHTRRLQKNKDETELFMIHELRSPIASIKAAADLIISQDEQLAKDKKAELLKVIDSQSIKMLDYISLLLDTAKLQSGVFLIQKTPNDIKEVIDERVQLYMPLAMQKSISMNVYIHGPIPLFFFDKQYIGQVISNLLSNSLKFTQQHGKINITADFDGKNVIIAVADTGSGLLKEEEKNLFHKFYQARRSETMNGTGLGLYFTKGIIDAHNGTIGVHSVLHEGTTITFTLPFIPV